MSHEQDAVKATWRDEEKMSYQDTRDVYFLKKRAELMAAGYSISKGAG